MSQKQLQQQPASATNQEIQNRFQQHNDNIIIQNQSASDTKNFSNQGDDGSTL